MSRARAGGIRRDETRKMEDEARKMEMKLELLRKTMDSTEPAAKGAEGGRWKGGAQGKPLTKGYVKGVLEAPKKIRTSQPRPDAAARSGPGSANASGKSTPTLQAQEGAVGAFLGVGKAAAAAPAPAALAATAAAEGGHSTTAAANLQTAMLRQSDEEREVEKFLAELKLDRYVGLFMEHGFDCMEVVKEMQESHMQDIGMAAGHILKLKKKLAEIAPKPPSAGLRDTQKRVSFGGVQSAPQAAGGAGSRGTQEGGTSAALTEGQFDEAESAASFQEALRAWREGRDVSDPAPPSGGAAVTGSGNSNSSSGPKPALKAPGSFWSTVGGGDMDLERASTPLRTPTELAATETETQHGPAPGDEKLCCYQCYKQFFAKHAVERHSPLPDGGVKRLCSEACASLWSAAMQEKAEALQKRQQQLGKMQEMQRAIEEETRAATAAAAAAASAA